MSLNWDLTKIHNNKNLCWIPAEDDKVTLSPVTDALIWMTMFVDYSNLKDEKRLKEFYIRARCYESMFGPVLREKVEYWAVVDEENFVTYDDKESAELGVATLAKNGAKAHVVSGQKTVDRPITLQDVYNHKGLITNCYGESDAKFKNAMFRKLREQVQRTFDRDLEEVEIPNAALQGMKEAINGAETTPSGDA
jgi:hypothetical protein